MIDEGNATRQVIVSGATGFVGSHLIPLLIARGYNVVAMARNVAAAQRHDWFKSIQFISADIRSQATAFKPAPGARLIHLAWPGLPNYRSSFHFDENLPDSYAFIKYLVKAGVAQVLVTGTCFEYGFQNGPLAASVETRPSNPYGFAKDALRKQLNFLQLELPFALQWARLFYMHGVGQHPRSIISQLDAAIDRGDATFDMSGGEQLRDYLHVGDVASQLVGILESGQDCISNVCSGVPISIRRLVENHVAARNATIQLNLGHYPYPDYEPMAFWGVPGSK